VTENVIVSRLAGQVAQVAINRPEAKNAIDETTRLALIDAIGDVLSDQSVRALLLCGNEGVFCAGGDLASMRGMDESQARQRMQSGHKLVNLLWKADIPVVIALEKFAIGAGAGLALLGDYIVAGENARVSFPFMQLGLIPDWGSTQSLIRRAGHSQTRRLILDKASLKGEQLLALNIADQIVPDTKVLETALAKATELANYPQLAFQQFKQTMRAFPSPFEDALTTEREQQTACFLSAEFEEGLTAMQEKRSPDFVKAAD
jgi:enoyl-CoA hydratase/carnithine racemase